MTHSACLSQGVLACASLPISRYRSLIFQEIAPKVSAINLGRQADPSAPEGIWLSRWVSANVPGFLEQIPRPQALQSKATTLAAERPLTPRARGLAGSRSSRQTSDKSTQWYRQRPFEARHCTSRVRFEVRITMGRLWRNGCVPVGDRGPENRLTPPQKRLERPRLCDPVRRFSRNRRAACLRRMGFAATGRSIR